ncbi:hypothetical protein P879_00671 [Paragonimus westermani]|uniref:Uncharacterized protein n=1 Tax=Paragonimus westermani TaxID=34504 RepID=A0A8T0DW98_9TREM|nr:hypothetical protein P879_00671 [Paragonimus westermani]
MHVSICKPEQHWTGEEWAANTTTDSDSSVQTNSSTDSTVRLNTTTPSGTAHFAGGITLLHSWALTLLVIIYTMQDFL